MADTPGAPASGTASGTATASAETFRPRTAEDVRDAVAWAVSETRPLDVRGQGSKQALGRPVQAGHVLDLSELSGVTFYEPEELVLTAKAGTPVAEIEALLSEHNQELSFEPMDFGPLLGQPEGQGTLGGLYAANLAGPRRLKAGAARDHVLGLDAVSGRGEIFKAGGRVVKNVTGYDLSRGLAGSWGTLAVATEITFKVMPRADVQDTLLIAGLDEAAAVKAMAEAMGSPAEVSAAAHLPADVAAATGVALPEGPATVIRLEGIGPSVDYRAAALATLLKPYGAVTRLGAEPSPSLWAAIRDVRAFAGGDDAVWKLSVTPSQAPAVTSAVKSALGGSVSVFYDWAGGLIWLRAPQGVDAAAIRAAIAANDGGHATLIRASAATRAAVPVFQPQEPALAALSTRLKAQFDPEGILNPGRMVAGV